MGREIADEHVKIWESTGGKVVVKEYSRQRISKFWHTAKGTKFDSWKKALVFLQENHPEKLPPHLQADASATKPQTENGSVAAGSSSGTAMQSSSSSQAPLQAKNTNETGKATPNTPATKIAMASPSSSSEDFEARKVVGGKPGGKQGAKQLPKGRKARVVKTPSPAASVEIVSSKGCSNKKQEEEDDDIDEEGSSSEDEDEDEAFSPSSSDSDADSDWEPSSTKRLAKGKKRVPSPSPKREKAPTPPKPPPPKRQRQQKANEFFHATSTPASQPQPQPQTRRQPPPQRFSQPQPPYRSQPQPPYTTPAFPQQPLHNAPPQPQRQPQPHVRQPPQASQHPQPQPGWETAVVAAAAALAGASRPQPATQLQLQGNESHHQVANMFYQAGDFVNAEVKYTMAIQDIENLPTASTRKADLRVLYGNRAASRLKLGKVEQALQDNWHSLELDPSYAKAYARICDCHLRGGGFNKAREVLHQALEKLSEDKKPEIQQKLAQIHEMEKACKKLLEDVCKDSSNEQLARVLNDAKATIELMQASDPIVVAQAIAMLRLMRFSELLAVCKEPQTVPWHWWFVLQVKYHEGNLAEALKLLESKPQASPEAQAAYAALGLTWPPDSELQALAQEMQQLLSLKDEGNQAVAQKQWQLATDKYTAALAMNPPLGFAAVLYSNRARSTETLENHMEALADCGRAKALNPLYGKPYLRLATLLTDFRRPSEAISLLQDMQEHLQPGSREYNDAALLLQEVRPKAAFLKTPDHYKFLCLQRPCTEDDVRRNYKKRALMFHPDKAIGSCKCVLQMGNSGFALVSSDLHARIKKEAHTLFTYIGEAYEQLSDSTKRQQVDIKLTTELNTLHAAMRPKATNSRGPPVRPHTNQPPANFTGFHNFSAPQAQQQGSTPFNFSFNFTGQPSPAMHNGVPPAGMGAAPGFGVPPPGQYPGPPFFTSFRPPTGWQV